MTTDYTNMSNMGLTQPNVRRLPPVTNSLKTENNTDNIVRINFSQRQDVAHTNETSKIEGKVLANNKHAEGEVKQSIVELNNSSQLISRNLEFHIDKNSGRTVITVLDTDSKEVIRQIPSEQLLEISSRLNELQVSNLEDIQAAGILFNGKT